MKCEPSAYSIDDLEKDVNSCWEGVRNYQARNFMRDQMQPGDIALFYHSNAEPSGVAGVMKIARAGYPDHFAYDAGHKYYDARSTPDKPVWYMVDVTFVAKFASILPLQQIKTEPRLQGIMVAQQGNRLSVQPLSEEHFKVICAMAGRKILP